MRRRRNVGVEMCVCLCGRVMCVYVCSCDVCVRVMCVSVRVMCVYTCVEFVGNSSVL